MGAGGSKQSVQATKVARASKPKPAKKAAGKAKVASAMSRQSK